jgi:hypothetical protein
VDGLERQQPQGTRRIGQKHPQTKKREKEKTHEKRERLHGEKLGKSNTVGDDGNEVRDGQKLTKSCDFVFQLIRIVSAKLRRLESKKRRKDKKKKKKKKRN